MNSFFVILKRIFCTKFVKKNLKKYRKNDWSGFIEYFRINPTLIYEEIILLIGTK